jgi:hypothetical protein
MVVGFTTTCAISAYHHYSCEFEPSSWRGVIDTTLCDQVCQWLVTGQWFSPGSLVKFPLSVCQWLVTGQWFSPGSLVSSINKTDHHDITEILLKVALNTITLYCVGQDPHTISTKHQIHVIQQSHLF